MTPESYLAFLRAKIPQAEVCGFEPPSAPHFSLFPHQGDLSTWACRGGRRAVFANFGMGKTRINLQVAKWVVEKTRGRFLIICPLGVRQEFTLSDGPAMDVQLEYVTSSEEVLASSGHFFITNYERVRDGGIDLDLFDGVALDEASVLRSYGSQTYQAALKWGRKVKYRFVFTATPSPNRYKELIHYAAFLGVMDSGEALTRFFQRDSEDAGNLTLYPHMEQAFWAWVSSWAVFLQKPSDLGYSDEGYTLPKMEVHWHRVGVDHTKAWGKADSWGQHQLFMDEAQGLAGSAKVKRESINLRIVAAREIMAREPADKHWLLWHDLEAERAEIERTIPDAKTVYGTQDLEDREALIMGFSRGEYQTLATKPIIAGSGCNFQRHCADAIFLGVGYKFNDFIQSCHRIYRFGQKRVVHIHIVYLESEDGVVADLKAKWVRHNQLMATMSEILRKNKLSNLNIMELTRTLGCERSEVKSQKFRIIRNDAILELMPRIQIYDKSTARLASGSQTAEEGIRPDLPGEKSSEEASCGARVVSKESAEADRESDSSTQKESGGTPSGCAQICTRASGEDRGQDAGVVSSEPSDCSGTREGIGAEEALRNHAGSISGDAGKAERPVRNLRGGREKKAASAGGSLPQDGQSQGNSLLPVQHGAGAVSGQPGSDAERDPISGEAWRDDSIDMILTSIPFGNQYEYSPSYSDLGHNPNNEAFFRQLEFLVPNLLRVLKPGRIAAIHVKDRIRFGNVTGDGFPIVDRFSDKTADCFERAGFRLLARITIDTDVVRENNQTYRLGWSENAKDGTKMGAGMPEYVLVFRKLPTDTSVGFADVPVTKPKTDYTRADWQIDAAGIWRSSGNRLPDAETMRAMTHPEIIAVWKKRCLAGIYSHDEHVAAAKALEAINHLPATFMLFAAISRNKDIWSDISRMVTLNTKQAQDGREKHVCPLQLDIIKRLITRYTNPGDVVFDPFMGIGSVGYQAIKQGRRAIGTELCLEYWKDSIGYMEMAEREIDVPTLFDLAQINPVIIAAA